MALIALFMVNLGRKAGRRRPGKTRFADFPSLSVGVTYLPIPLGGAILLLFVIERIAIGPPRRHRRRRSQRRVRLERSAAPMDIFVLLATMFACFIIGMPIAYSLALAAIAGALWIGIPLEAVMLKISDGVSKVAMLTIPFFVLAGAIMAEGGMARRLVAFADVLVGFTRVRGGLSVVNVLATTFLSGISGSAVADTSAIGSVMIPQMEKSGYPRVFATNVTISASVQALLVPPSHNAVIYSLATGGTISIISSVHGRRGAGAPARLRDRHSLPRHRLSRRPSARHYRAGARGGQDHHRRGLGPDHTGHHSRRHPRRRVHRDRSRRGGLRLGVPGDDVRLSRLSLARSAGARAPHAPHRRHGADPDRLRLERRLRDGADANAGDGSRRSS